MKDGIYFIKSGETVEIAKTRFGEIATVKTFEKKDTDKIVSYLLESGMTEKKVGEQKKLVGNLYLYGGGELKLYKGGERYFYVGHRLEYEFFRLGGFVGASDTGCDLQNVKTAKDVIAAHAFFSKSTFSEQELTNVKDDAKRCFDSSRWHVVSFGKSVQVLSDGSRLLNDLNVLYVNGKKEEIKALFDNACVKKDTKDGERKRDLFSCLVLFEKTLFEHGEDLTACLPNGLNGLLEKFKGKVENDFIPVGIFWVANGKLLLHKRSIAKTAIATNKSLTVNDRVDCGYAHVVEWEKHEKDYPDKDFASFPRGRVLFDLKTDEHVIFVDDCIKENSIKELIKKMRIKKYRVEKDEHYSCDNCVEKKDIWND